MVSGVDACVEGKRFGQVGRVVIPNVQIGVIGARGKEVTTGGPTALVSQ